MYVQEVIYRAVSDVRVLQGIFCIDFPGRNRKTSKNFVLQLSSTRYYGIYCRVQYITLENPMFNECGYVFGNLEKSLFIHSSVSADAVISPQDKHYPNQL